MQSEDKMILILIGMFVVLVLGSQLIEAVSP